MSDRKIPDALLERYLAGDVDEALRRDVDERLSASAPDRERLESLRQDSAAFLAAHPPGPMVARFEEHRRVRRRRWWIGLLVPAVVLGGAAAVVFVFTTQVLPPIDHHDIRLAVFAASSSGGAATPMEVATTGDAVRFLLRGSDMGYIAVLGRDANGDVHVYAPKDGPSAVRYDPKQPMLPEVAQLSKGSGREEIIGLFSPKPFELAPVVDALRARRPLSGLLPEGSVSATVPLEKREAPASRGAVE